MFTSRVAMRKKRSLFLFVDPSEACLDGQWSRGNEAKEEAQSGTETAGGQGPYDFSSLLSDNARP
jgi:hypothetical protein